MKIDLATDARRPLHNVHQTTHVVAGHGEAGESDHQRVARKDFRERLADDGTDAAAGNRLRRVLPRGPAAEVRVDEKNAGIARGRIVEWMPPARGGRVRAIVLEDVSLEAVERDRFQESRGDDAIRVDVVAGHHEPPAVDPLDTRRHGAPV